MKKFFKKNIKKVVKSKIFSVLLRPRLLSAKSRLGRYMIRELTPRIAMAMQKCFKVKKGKVSSFGTGGVSPIQFRLVRRQLNKYKGLKIKRYNTYFGRSFFARLIGIPYNMATSEVIIVEDVYRPIKYLKRSENQMIIQTWHALGAFKKFGLANVDNLIRLDGEDTEELKIIHVYDYALDPGFRFREKYLESFAQGCKILEGVFNPRVDLLFDEGYIASKKAKLYEMYPQLIGKKVLLYTPTYRGFSDRADSSHFMDFDGLLDRLDDSYMVILKKHPSMKSSSFNPPSEHNQSRFMDLSKANVNDLMLISDILINDYSSTFFEFALLGKPVIFLAKDLHDYIDSRGFYFDFKDFVPGPICMDEETLAENVLNSKGDNSMVVKFVEEYFGEVPMDSAARLARFVVDYVNRDGVELVTLKPAVGVADTATVGVEA